MDEEILLIDKPKGITSFDVIRRLRKQTGIRKMGHAGTLDPLASGLMIIGVNKGTKKLNDFIKLDKVYEAEVLLGVQTSSGDLEGKVLETKEVNEVDQQKIKKVIKELVGKQVLPVPVFSAIKRGGEALYKKARRGEKVEAPKKEMEIYNAKILDSWSVGNILVLTESEMKEDPSPFEGNNFYILSLRLEVSSGTYIRSIAEEVGRRLGLPATLKELRRTSIGDFDIKQACKLDG